MKNFTALAFVSFLIFSCSENKNSTDIVKEKSDTVKKEKIVVKANSEFTASIEGMVCEMGCGGSIRKELYKTNAVEYCNFEFEEERKENMVTIGFDDTKVKAEKIKSILENMNEKQFKVSNEKKNKIVSIKKMKKNEQKEVKIHKTDADLFKKDLVENSSESNNTETLNLLQIMSRCI